MHIGIFTGMTDETIRPGQLAAAVEERGFESLFVPEHTHIPASRETPYEGGGELPRPYYRVLDPIVTLTSAAAATTSLRLGTAVSLVAQHDPIVLAKQIATLDLISGGRIEVGAGAGWNREEMRNHGTDPRTRTRVLRERILAMKEIWTRDRASFHGEFVDFDPIFSWPKPCSARTHRSCSAVGDVRPTRGWSTMPTAGSHRSTFRRPNSPRGCARSAHSPRSPAAAGCPSQRPRSGRTGRFWRPWRRSASTEPCSGYRTGNPRRCSANSTATPNS
jgi:hypothetical protein